MVGHLPSLGESGGCSGLNIFCTIQEIFFIATIIVNFDHIVILNLVLRGAFAFVLATFRKLVQKEDEMTDDQLLCLLVLGDISQLPALVLSLIGEIKELKLVGDPLEEFDFVMVWMLRRWKHQKIMISWHSFGS